MTGDILWIAQKLKKNLTGSPSMILRMRLKKQSDGIQIMKTGGDRLRPGFKKVSIKTETSIKTDLSVGFQPDNTVSGFCDNINLMMIKVLIK